MFITWGQRIVISCAKFSHQSYANHLYKHFTVNKARGTQVSAAAVFTEATEVSSMDGGGDVTVLFPYPPTAI
jgi:hypothetical protein